MNIQGFIENLQKKPYAARIKILWGTASVVAIIVFVIWIVSLRSTVRSVDLSSVTKADPTAQNAAAASSYIAVERVETNSGSLKIYFNFNNTTNDILNISKISDITLVTGGKTLNPQLMTDRQGQTFVQKILSHTQNFGILTFSGITADSGQLVFNQMFFEQSPASPLSQKLDLNFKTLAKPANLRN